MSTPDSRLFDSVVRVRARGEYEVWDMLEDAADSKLFVFEHFVTTDSLQKAKDIARERSIKAWEQRGGRSLNPGDARADSSAVKKGELPFFEERAANPSNALDCDAPVKPEGVLWKNLHWVETTIIDRECWHRWAGKLSNGEYVDGWFKSESEERPRNPNPAPMSASGLVGRLKF